MWSVWTLWKGIYYISRQKIFVLFKFNTGSCLAPSTMVGECLLFSVSVLCKPREQLLKEEFAAIIAQT